MGRGWNCLADRNVLYFLNDSYKYKVSFKYCDLIHCKIQIISFIMCLKIVFQSIIILSQYIDGGGGGILSGPRAPKNM